MAWYRKREIPLGITILVGTIMILSFFAPVDPLVTLSSDFKKWGSLMGAFFILLGILMSIMYHIKQITRKTKDQWYWSILVLTLIALYAIPALIWGQSASLPNWLYNNVNVPAGGATYGILGFFIFSALYRTLRVRNLDVFFFTLAVTLVMLGNNPLVTSYLPIFDNIRAWLVVVLTGGVEKGFLIGLAIAAVLLGLRTFAGQEKGFLGR